MSDLEAAKQIYFDRCDTVSTLAERFTEEEVWDLMVRAIVAEREACAATAEKFADLYPNPESDLTIGVVAGTVGAALSIRRRGGDVNTANNKIIGED